MNSKKNVLGRGLTSLLGENITSDNFENKNLVKEIPIEQLEPGPWQARKIFSKEEIKNLAVSIKAQGVINPIIVTKQKNSKNKMFFIIAGERRWRACQIAKKHNIPAIVYENINKNKATEISLLENIQRKDLNVIEEAYGYKKLIDEHNYTQETVSKKIGKSRSQIANLLRLLKLPKTVLNLLEEEKISFGHARSLIEHPYAEDISKTVIKNNLSVRETERYIKNFSKNKIEPKNFKEKNLNIKKLEDETSNILGLKVKINYKDHNNSSKIVISCSSNDQLNYNLQRLGLEI